MIRVVWRTRVGRCVAVLAGLALVSVLAWPARAERPAETEARLLKHLKFLAGEGCEGRGITTKGINLAAEYIAREFQSAGLKPGGPDGTYFQPFTLTTGGKIGKNCRLSLRGPLGQVIAIDHGKQFRPSLYGGSGKVEAPVVFAGYGITSKSPSYDDYAGLDVAGKVVVVLNGSPLSAPSGRFFPLSSSPKAKIDNARAHKAAAILLVNTRPRSARERDRLPRRERLSIRGGGPSTLPAAYLRRAWVEKMLPAKLGADLARVEKDIEADRKPRSQALTGWTCRLQTEVVHNQIKVKNVIGVLEGGGTRSQETIVLGAHYDHLGLGAASRFGGPRGGRGGPLAGPGAPGGVGFPLFQLGGSSLFHGADDNASGTTTILELARRFGARKERTGRRLVFMTFTAEESGLIGSRYYCSHPAFPLESTVAMINMDMVGRLQDGKLLVGGAGTAKEFVPLLDRLNRKHRLQLFKEMSGQGPSDHASFFAHNIPVLFFFTGFHEQYHRPTDRVETINVSGLRRIADLVEEVTGELRQAPKRPAFIRNTTGFARDKTLWAKAPSIGVLPDHGHKGEGVRLEGVVDNTPAARAGLKKGDRLVAIGGKPVKDLTAFLAVTRALPMGKKVEVTVVRDGKQQQIALQLALPTAGSRTFTDPRFGYALDYGNTKGGLLIAGVPKGSPAEKAGLKKGDRVVSLAGKPAGSLAPYFNALSAVQGGTKVKVTVKRGGKTLTFQVQTAATPTRPVSAYSRFGATPDFDNTRDGVLLDEVLDDSPADRARLKEGDRIIALAGKPVKTLRDFTTVLRGIRAGTKFEVTIVRGGKTHKLQASFK